MDFLFQWLYPATPELFSAVQLYHNLKSNAKTGPFPLIALSSLSLALSPSPSPILFLPIEIAH